MFVTNCAVRMDEVLRYDKTSSAQQKKTKHKSKQRRGMADDSAQASTGADPAAATNTDGDVYHPVVCSVCNSEVGVYDKDEVYHFFNVLASYA